MGQNWKHTALSNVQSQKWISLLENIRNIISMKVNQNLCLLNDFQTNKILSHWMLLYRWCPRKIRCGLFSTGCFVFAAENCLFMLSPPSETKKYSRTSTKIWNFAFNNSFSHFQRIYVRYWLFQWCNNRMIIIITSFSNKINRKLSENYPKISFFKNFWLI